MLAAERQNRIMELIQRRGGVHVEELAEDLKVSTMTIRRDLVKLQAENKLERCHGGAVAKQEVIYADKQTSYIDEKRRIARVASTYVHEGDTIFLDAGTTTYEIAQRISDKDSILIVTNDLEIARVLHESPVEVYICGGKIQKSTGSMFDVYATQMLRDFRFDIGFFGAACINGKYEVMTPTREKMWIKRMTPEQCESAYLVADSSKFGRQGLSYINDLKDYTGIITDKEFTEAEQRKMKAMQIKMISV